MGRKILAISLTGVNLDKCIHSFSIYPSALAFFLTMIFGTYIVRVSMKKMPSSFYGSQSVLEYKIIQAVVMHGMYHNERYLQRAVQVHKIKHLIVW